jgi:hypothetical protein
MHKAEIVVDDPWQWLPRLSRRHDIHLLPYFQANGMKDKEITLLNMCRLYLKVITLSDITSADGTYILPEAKHGSPIQGRSSNLEWPEQGRPPKRAWSLWSQSLSALEHRGKLNKNIRNLDNPFPPTMGNLDRHRHKSSLPAKGGNTL